MKICLIFIGAVRECITNIGENINSLKECFDGYGYDVDIVFSSWEPIKGFYNHEGINYIYDYDKDELDRQLDNVVNLKKMIFKQKNMEFYEKCINGAPAIFLYHLKEISSEINKSGIKYDFVVRSRHDNLIKLKNVNKYLKTNETYAPPLYNSPVLKYNKEFASGHFFITGGDEFGKISNINEYELIKDSKDCEQVESKLLNFISDNKWEYISDDDIIKFVNRNMLRIWK